MTLPVPLRSWLAEHARVVVITAVVVGLGLATTQWFGGCRQPEPATATAIKAMQAVNTALGKQVDSLQAANRSLQAVRVKLSAQRDSLEKQSAHATQAIKQARVQLPPADLVPDTALRPAYRVALATIDSSLSELARRDSIEASYRRDSTLAAQQHTQDSISLALRLTQITTVQGEADVWKQEAKAAHQFCGRTCGVVLGVLGTIGAAIALHTVVH